MILKVGPYTLTQQIETAEGLLEFTEEEYLTAEYNGFRRNLEDERFFNGANIKFASAPWNSTMIGSTNGQIYKISLQCNTRNKMLAKIALQTTVSFVNTQIGKYNEHPLFSSKYIWDTNEGNIILYKKRMLQWFSINIFFTSSLIRNQVLKIRNNS
jgi:hypothetical protein